MARLRVRSVARLPRARELLARDVRVRRPWFRLDRLAPWPGPLHSLDESSRSERNTADSGLSVSPSFLASIPQRLGARRRSIRTCTKSKETSRHREVKCAAPGYPLPQRQKAIMWLRPLSGVPRRVRSSTGHGWVATYCGLAVTRADKRVCKRDRSTSRVGRRWVMDSRQQRDE